MPVKKYCVKLEEGNRSSIKMIEGTEFSRIEVTPDNIYRTDELLPEEIRIHLLKRYNDWEVGTDQ